MYSVSRLLLSIAFVSSFLMSTFFFPLAYQSHCIFCCGVASSHWAILSWDNSCHLSYQLSRWSSVHFFWARGSSLFSCNRAYARSSHLSPVSVPLFLPLWHFFPCSRGKLEPRIFNQAYKFILLFRQAVHLLPFHLRWVTTCEFPMWDTWDSKPYSLTPPKKQTLSNCYTGIVLPFGNFI